MSSNKKLAIACQGGGSHTAFTAGVLKKLFEERIHDRYRIVGLSGTSGGGICATAIWYGLLKAANGAQEPIYQTLLNFWSDNAAKFLWEQSLNDWIIQVLRWQDTGLMPVFAVSPYTTEWLTDYGKSLLPRSEYFDLKQLLEKHIDFEAIQQLVDPSSPRLVLGAVDILSGRFKAFDSKKGEIRVEALLASAAIPNLFKAVEINGEAYWDGLFSENPPVGQLLRVEVDRRPDEIWMVQINPQTRKAPPLTAEAIIDRRNELSGNLALYQEVRFIEQVNEWIEAGLFRETAVGQLKPIQIRWIRMNPDLAESLDYASKLNRDPQFIAQLMADGEQQATAFLSQLS